MAAYADYTYYTGTYLGTAIASADFARLALRASEVIDEITFGRASIIVAAATDTATIALIKNATCAVAEKYQENEAAGGNDGIASESIGANSVTYTANAYAQLSQLAKLAKAAKTYLGNTGLMFKGFASGEYSGDIDDEDE
jgi:hypothetical protein